MTTNFGNLVEQWLQPDWSVPGVQAYVSTRAGGFSQPPYDGFNTADHVGDDAQAVQRNRERVKNHFHWRSQPQWMQQVHGINVVEAGSGGASRQADAIVSHFPGVVCALHTADCLPVFFAHHSGSVVALAHAGWRGLAAGVVEASLHKMGVPANEVRVWLGPAIGPSAFEVGEDVRSAFMAQHPQTQRCFVPSLNDRWLCDLYSIARLRLGGLGVTQITGGEHCTYSDPRFYSYRRQAVTGRMLSLIWIDPPHCNP
ncbi:peptidoglycan editing factor PgeF [Ketobacter sp. MCCC 1A13808]|uniref:peptidoglycan editing factor PgeF n=1 Tax=Ketobacter sp. MCCC 1A13808 TaxID=2602738 RepID=UPI000F1B564A|nr:peptidoglycan editing factor PgeF [Ketobacter sp. MCCC 1A13808]MVF14765.1 peptidoglycan editing factor PgeF [Ketobacter sp. MCCC 1A13808]RLP52669.1 MAG: peptidoglycan editing factor PgeF [Ketobacter sp.]